MCFNKRFAYIQGILFKIILSTQSKNEIIVVENMLSMHAEKSSSEQMFWIYEKTRNTGENIFEFFTS